MRSARPGAVSPAGFFGTRGSVDPDLLVRCELRDRDGNVSGRRPRLSDLAGLGGAALLSPEVPVPTAPVPGGDTPGRSYDLRFPDTLPDATGFAGLYRVQIDDFLGRSWILWRPDPMGAGEVRVHVPDIEGAGGMPLADGLQSVAIAAYAWGSLDPSEFLWTDVEREQDLFAVGASFDLTQTP